MRRQRSTAVRSAIRRRTRIGQWSIPPTVRDAAADTPATTSIAAVEPAPPVTRETAPAADPSAVVPPQAAATPEAATATDPLHASPGRSAARGCCGERCGRCARRFAASRGGSLVQSNRRERSLSQGPPELGTYLSGKTVLLRYDEPKGGWFRVEPRSAVVAGERLLSLPEFRPQITLASGVMLDMSGGTQVVMMAGETKRRRQAGRRAG